MTILITGGAGFIGTNICLLAKKKGYSVVAMDSFIRPKSEENIPILQEADVEILRGDVRNMHDLHRSPLPEAIIHLAANPGIPWSIRWPDYDFAVNAMGTVNILEYARKMGDYQGKKIPVIFASTNKVYSDLINEIPLEEEETSYSMNVDEEGLSKRIVGGVSETGINENFPIDGLGKYSHSPYGCSKLVGDIYCQEYYQAYGVPTVVNRMSCIYGYYQKGVADQGWLDHFIRQTLVGKPELDIFGDGKQVRDMLWGEDVAELYLSEIENIDKVKGQVFNVGGGIFNAMSLIEAIKHIEKISNKKFKLNHHDWRHADQKVYLSDIQKIRSFLDWKPKTSPKEGIEKIYNFYTKHAIT